MDNYTQKKIETETSMSFTPDIHYITATNEIL